MSDYIYDAPPLVEVIAEVHWAVQRMVSIPDAGIDPLYAKCLEALRKSDKLHEYRFEEKIVPDGVPIEFFANKALVRFRKGPKAWPLFQLGPGLFVTNLVPPYRGWNEFRSILTLGLQALFESYPSADQLLEITKLELRYVDAFMKQHNLTVYSQFLVEGLQMSVQLPTKLVEASVAGGMDHVITTSDVSFPLTKMANTTGNIKVSPGTAANKEPAVIVQFGTTFKGAKMPTKIEEIIKWFDGAHSETREWFELLTADAVKKTFGNKTQI